jgi:hypothetical protein
MLNNSWLYFPVVPELLVNNSSLSLEKNFDLIEIIGPKDPISFQYNLTGELLSLYRENSNFLLQLIIKSPLPIATTLVLGDKVQYHSPNFYEIKQDSDNTFVLPSIPFNESIIKLLFLSQEKEIISNIHWQKVEKKIIFQEDTVKSLYFFPVFSLVIVNINQEINKEFHEITLSLVSSCAS